MAPRTSTSTNTAVDEPAGEPGMHPSTRSAFLRAALTLGVPLVVTACGPRAAASSPAAMDGRSSAASGGGSAPAATAPAGPGSAAQQPPPSLPLTPAGSGGDDGDVGEVGAPASLTPAQTEGPYFKPNSPERTSLLDARTAGTRLLISGRVLSQAGRPVAHALLDFWQASDGGSYDNSGYTLRGHQYTGADGRYQVETIIPGLYPGRTRHVHVKVQAPGGPILTTQLYFPGEARNSSDGIFDARLLLPIQDAPNGKIATFDFVIRTA